jgi:hypothetical protein
LLFEEILKGFQLEK